MGSSISSKPLTIPQTAEYLQCSNDTVRRMISRGELKASRFGPRMIRIDPLDLEKVRKPVTNIAEVLGDAA